jgi:hypothetical protein
MKKIIVIVGLLCIFMRVSTSDFLNFRAFEESKKFAETLKINNIVFKLMVTFSEIESGHNYTANGQSGEKGRYQYMPRTWKSLCKKYFGKEVSNTPEYQELVTYNILHEYIKKGYAIDQIASIWNCGSPKYEGKIGINQFSVAYNVPAYVNKFVNAYRKVSTGMSSTHLCSINRSLYLIG